jgi:dTMP kinase
MRKGLFISFEGTDGCGKSTQIKLFSAYLDKLGIEHICTREPGGPAVSEKIRRLLLDPENSDMTPMCEALLYAASRTQTVSRLIAPSLEKGLCVVCDRFLDSSIAYQGYARGLGDSVRAINEYAVLGTMPDITYFLDMPPAAAEARRRGRGSLDRLELEGLSFQEAVYEGYVRLSEIYPGRIVRIDAGGTPEEVFSRIKDHFDSYVKG